VLQFNGFETYDFIDPRLALDTFKQSPQSYDLVLMDIKMQEMDGKICPSFEEKQLIQKPVRMSSLVNTVNEAMTSI